MTDSPGVGPLLDALCKEALGMMNNHFPCAYKLREKRRDGKKTTRIYGPAQSAYACVMEAAEMNKETKARLRAEHAADNSFQLAREIEKQKKRIEGERQMRA